MLDLHFPPPPVHQQTQHNLGEGREDIMVPCDKYTQYENSTMKKAIMITGWSNNAMLLTTEDDP